MLDQMSLSELQAFAARIYVQIERSPSTSLLSKIELEHVESWIALRQKEAETSLDLSPFVNAL